MDDTKQTLDLDALLTIVRKRTPDHVADPEIGILICDNCGRWYPDDADSDSESCDDPKCGRFKQRMDWVVLHPVAVKAICAAVNNFEAVAERCKLAEEWNDYDATIADLTRQRDELLAEREEWNKFCGLQHPKGSPALTPKEARLMREIFES